MFSVRVIIITRFFFSQIERQLRAYLRRVEDVLGKDWENHIEGQGLKADGDSFRQKLNTQEIFDDWSQQVQKRALLVVGRIFAIDTFKSRGVAKTLLKIKVNFTKDVITLAKEVLIIIICFKFIFPLIIFIKPISFTIILKFVSQCLSKTYFIV